MGIIKQFLSNVGTNGALAIAGILLPIILSMVKTKKYGNALDDIMVKAGKTVSLFFNTKFGAKLENIIEWFIIRVIFHLVFFPIMAFILGMRQDDAVNLTDGLKNVKIKLEQIIKR